MIAHHFGLSTNGAAIIRTHYVNNPATPHGLEHDIGDICGAKSKKILKAAAARHGPETAGGYTRENFFRVIGLLNRYGGSWGAWQPALSITGAHWACPDSLIASNLATRDWCLGKLWERIYSQNRSKLLPASATTVTTSSELLVPMIHTP